MTADKDKIAMFYFLPSSRRDHFSLFHKISKNPTAKDMNLRTLIFQNRFGELLYFYFHIWK